jgi:hypothetical protein
MSIQANCPRCNRKVDWLACANCGGTHFTKGIATTGRAGWFCDGCGLGKDAELCPHCGCTIVSARFVGSGSGGCASLLLALAALAGLASAFALTP